MNVEDDLINKYHVPAPRYTSYPTVPYWNAEFMGNDEWIKSVRFSFEESNTRDGISLYVHLPFCENLCTYCGCNTRITKNHTVEEPYIQTLLKEWDLYKSLFKEKPVIKEIHLGGGTPTFFSPDNLELLIKGLFKDAIIHQQAEFSFEGHPANTTEEHLKTLYKLGFRRVSLGIQDFDPLVQVVINRMQSYEDVKSVTDQARKIGYLSVNYDLIYGLPIQTLEGLEKTIHKTLLLMPDRIAFYSYAHVPWVKPGQRRYTEKDLPSVELKQKLYELGREMLINAGYLEIGMDHFALPSDSLYKAQIEGLLHRNFMGYTHQYTQLMIGLGVSSISDTLYAFAQNEKKVEDYRARVEAGQIPVFKGHLLTKEDLIIRQHIQNIMCNGSTSWQDPNLQCKAFMDGLKRLKSLEEDGLITLEPFKLLVLPQGQRFLRNICMALDARLWANQPKTVMFSMAG
ncbi:Coproporphyrinogen III oxidase, oxygen-independent [Arcticibacter svalbardensis MN12-7]|uniref:Coproporphyrinogen-III oxidase n=1 Tax=Arcticibacter svalbardensis MN12-7 TaxID=1150600 RepID=R9GUI3_9SPHI|nr:oxygen-independent coproporphyrinogen III oxidase [Arcticibacter svalbardensis]EOR95150.1 Coproporphyrinogen III oxidase, oxygen-independent [Arcticibacter svalbardensis MN12-7]